MKSVEPVQAVLKNMALLEILSEHDNLGITELSEHTQINKSTVYRFMTTLKDLGYVCQIENTERYGLSFKLHAMASRILSHIDVRTIALPTLERIAKLTEETIHLAALDGRQLVYLHKIESTRSLRVAMRSKVGFHAPLYCTGIGKVLLAWKETEFIQQFIDSNKLVKYTENTITERIGLMGELQSIRTKGYSVDNEEHEIGVFCVASPVRDHTRQVIAAISISLPKIRLSEDNRNGFIELVMGGAQEISKNLGYKNRL